jgi:hypothetical protein
LSLLSKTPCHSSLLLNMHCSNTATRHRSYEHRS